MRKLFKNSDKKLIASLLVIITLLSTVAIAYAANSIFPEMDSKGSYGTSETINFKDRYLTWADLVNDYDILCCYHGGNDSHLRNVYADTLSSGGKETNTPDTRKSSYPPYDENNPTSGNRIGNLLKEDEGNATALTMTEDTIESNNPYEEAHAESWAWYKATEIIRTSPDNSYILAEMISELSEEDRWQIFYDSGYSTVQYAWWVTDDNKGTNHNTKNTLYYEAEAFKNYIAKYAKSLNEDDFVNQDYEFTDENGVLHTGTVPAPELEYEPVFNEDANQDKKVEKDEFGNPTGKDKVTVTFDRDTNTYTIGPFSIDYAEEWFRVDENEEYEYAVVDEEGNPVLDEDGNQVIKKGTVAEIPQNKRDPVRFASITNAQLFTNLGEVDFAIEEDPDNFDNPIEEKEGAKWRFNFLKDQRPLDDDYRFPHANEVFYIELDYIPGATEITNLHFDFKYMNAGGRYERLEGTYFEQTWTPNEKVIATCSGPSGTATTCSHGKTSSHPTKWQYWLDLTSMVQRKSQLLAYGVIGARWYEYTDLDLDLRDFSYWDYEIFKDVVDEDGNPVSTKDKFVFDVYKDGELFDQVKVRANVKFKSETYKLNMGEPVPDIEIKEHFDEETKKNYKLKGDISKEVIEELNRTTFSFKATNEVTKHKGKVSITKHLTDLDLEKLEEIKNKEFSMKLYIDGKLWDDPDSTDGGIIKIHPGETWTSPEIEWTGSTAPKYEVKEVNLPKDFKLHKYRNEKGDLKELPEIAEVEVINETDDLEHASIVIKKVLTEGSDPTTESFTVLINTGTKLTSDGKVDKTDPSYNPKYVTVKANSSETREFTWKKGTPAPYYDVEEIDIPAGWEFVDTENDHGQLNPDAEAEPTVVTVKNKQSDDEEGWLTITKSAPDELKNIVFKFRLYIDGVLQKDTSAEDYSPDKGDVYGPDKDGTIWIKPGNTWDSRTFKEYKWTKGTAAPKYKVEEFDIPDGIVQLSFNNAEDTLKPGSAVELVAKNGKGPQPHSAKIIVKKECIEGTPKPTDVFDFLVDTAESDGHHRYTASLHNGESREFKFTWNEGESEPSYEVHETNLPAGWEFVSITDNYKGTVKDGEVIEIVCKNRKVDDKKGRVSIKKTASDDLLDREFTFKLYINEVEKETFHIKPNEEPKVSQYYTWNSSDGAPSYRVEEVDVDDDITATIENGSGHLVEGDTPILVIADNQTDKENGDIILKKVLDDGITSDKDFKFNIKITTETKNSSGTYEKHTDEFTKTLKAGQEWKESFTWDKGHAPTYEIEEIEIPDGFRFVKMETSHGTVVDKKASGTLEKGTTVRVICYNAGDEKSGKLSVTKRIETDDKLGVDVPADITFPFTIKISGTFEYGDESISNGTKVIDKDLSPDETWESPLIKWLGDAPSYEVIEHKDRLPEGWKFKSISANSKGKLENSDKPIQVICTNEYGITFLYDLTMEMAGVVWEDAPLNVEDKNTPDSKPNGLLDDSEERLENVEVVIWKILYQGKNEVRRVLATGYEEDSNTEITFPLYTSIDGIWAAKRMSVPGITDEEKAEGITRADYDVEFWYDGQTYKPTDFLVSGSAADFRRGTNARRNEYNRDSMAIETEEDREAFDNKFAVITGDTPISDDGITNGYAEGGSERVDLEYYATDSMPSLDGNTRKISELQTLKDGFIRDQFKMPARTSSGGLTWPFDEKTHLEYIEKYIDKIEGGLVIKYHYSATYPYLLNINLGLVRRDEAELAVTKDVYSANVVVNQKLMNYKFNEYIDFENEKYQDYLNLQLKIADANITYKLDLYESDYYYRASVYTGEVKGKLEEFYASIGKTNLSDELDLDVFLTYKISVYNNSDSYLASIKKLVDYYDEDLTLVDSQISKYIQEANGINVDAETVVAKPAYVDLIDTTGASKLSAPETITVSKNETSSIHSTIELNSADISDDMAPSDNVRTEDGKNYYKAEMDLSDAKYRLAVGEKLVVYLTFRVNRDEAPAKMGNPAGLADAVKSYVRLGTKSNVAEIGAYSTYYADTKKNAGKVDKDSAPNNVDIENKNDKKWYEDDTDSAPTITLDLYSQTRNINGMAWEDKESEEIDYNQMIGDGIYKKDEGEEPVANLTTEMVEKVRVKDGGDTYKEYDFVWPTSKQFDFLNNRTFEDITGFDSVTLTSDSSDEYRGTYEFKNIPAGNYVVRFVYGDFPYDDIDVDGNLRMTTSNDEAKTNDYGDTERKPAVYNGQDFKTTKYQADIEASKNVSNANGYIDNDWYDFESCEYDADGKVVTHNSDAMDNEARRLQVVAYSKVLDHTITTILATANEYTADHTELYKETNMFADTAKINLNIENMNSLSKQDFDSGKAGGEEVQNGIKVNYVYGKSYVNGGFGSVGTIDYKYTIDAIDFGLEERSNTELVLDKQIESIKLTPNTGGEPILKAIYNIEYSYEVDPATGKSKYKPSVKLNEEESFGTEHLLAQNKEEDKVNKTGTQNFRYIYYDDTISQSLNLEVKYRFSILNVGEVDRTSEWLENATDEQIAEKVIDLKDQTYKKDPSGKLISVKHPNVGEAVGSIYYIGKNDTFTQSDVVVKTKVRQLIDYVDNDAVFKAADNTALNSSWKSTTAQELLDTKAIDSNIIGDYDGMKNIVDDKGITYSTSERSNLILSVDGTNGDKLANPDFIVQLVPFTASKQNADLAEDKQVTNCQTLMNLVMTRSIDSQIDDDDLTYDNIAEIVKFENTVGKRDIETIAGNADPKLGEFTVSLDERDASATELITFTPPTGLNTQTALTIQMLMVSAVALVILAVGIVCIKKLVLKK